MGSHIPCPSRRPSPRSGAARSAQLHKRHRQTLLATTEERVALTAASLASIFTFRKEER